MKYIWIVMLLIIYIIWFITSLKDFLKTARYFKPKAIIDHLQDYTFWFILVHLLTLFSYSLCVFIEGLE